MQRRSKERQYFVLFFCNICIFSRLPHPTPFPPRETGTALFFWSAKEKEGEKK